MADYKGHLIHAQLWDPSTDYTGKRVLVIGSGATAATVVPACAEKAAHVTMLQRSPTYFLCAPNENELALTAARDRHRRTDRSTAWCAGRSCTISPRWTTAASRNPTRWSRN